MVQVDTLQLEKVGPLSFFKLYRCVLEKSVKTSLHVIMVSGPIPHLGGRKERKKVMVYYLFKNSLDFFLLLLQHFLHEK